MMKNLYGFFRWRLLIVIGMLIVGIGFPLSAQQLSDFKFTSEKGDGNCLNDMWIKINSERVTPLQDGEYLLSYNLRNVETGRMAYIYGESTPKNDFQGLHAGTYVPIIYLMVIDRSNADDIKETITKQELDPVTVTTSYTTPTIIVKLDRKPLQGYKDDDGTLVTNTGIISVSMISGESKCQIRIKEAPEGFKAQAVREIRKGQKFKYYGVSPGRYVFSIDDANCGNIGDRTIDVEYITNPYPIEGREWPVDDYSYQTEDMRLNHCGWFRNSLQNLEMRNFTRNVDIAPYFISLDTVAKYYQYAIYSDYLKNKGVPKVFHDFFEPDTPEHPYWNKEARTFTTKTVRPVDWVEYQYDLYCYVENPYAKLGAKSESPRFFLRVKGHEEGSETYKQLNPLGDGYVNTYVKFDGGNTCLNEFRLGVTTKMDWWRYLLCLPMKVELFDGGPERKKLDELVLEKSPTTDNEGALTEKDFVFFPDAKLIPEHIYYIKTTQPNGYTIEQQFVYKFKSNLEGGVMQIESPCHGKMFMIRLYNDSRSMSNYTITLKSAPEGYRPNDYPDYGFKRLHVGESYRPTTMKQGQERFFFPFCMETSLDGGGRLPLKAYLPYTSDASGDYVFEFKDDCGRTQTFTFNVPPLELTTYKYHPEYFEPRITRPSCGRIRIYPFAGENSDKILTLNGQPFDKTSLWIRYNDYPKAVKKDDITTNVMARWRGEDMIAMYNEQNGKGQNIPAKDIWIELPDTKGKLTMQVLAKGVDWTVSDEYSECFAPKLEVNLDNASLSYNHHTYSSYACYGLENGSISIEPINNVGAVTMELYDRRGGQLLDKKEGVNSLVKFTLGDYLKKTGGKVQFSYFMRITDPTCNNYVEEVLPVYDLSSYRLIATTPNQKNICPGEKLTLICASFGTNMTYTWTRPDGKQMTGRIVTIPAEEVTPKLSGVFNILVTGKTVCIEKVVYRNAFDLSISPDELWWNKPEDANWNNINNWYDKDGNPAHAIPAHCTNVHIPAHPGSKKTNDKEKAKEEDTSAQPGSNNDKGKDIFPDLDPSVSIQGDFSFPECNDIYFHYGSKLGNPQELNYHHAYVDYNFGMVTPEAPNQGKAYTDENVNFPEANNEIMHRDKWYMLAAPLHNMYSADFNLAGYPMIYSRYVKINQSEPLTDASFGASYAKLNSLFSSDEYDKSKTINGMAVKVDGYDTYSQTGESNQKNLDKLKGIIRIPYFEDNDRLKAYPLEQYDPETHKSKVWYFNRRTLKPLNRYEEIARSEKAYRFVFETEYADGKSGISMIPKNGTAVKGYAASTDKIHSGEWFMLGNPFMSPIDFDKFYEINEGYIESYYYIYEDGKWKVYSKDNKIASTLGSVIEPMQSILLRKKGGTMLAFPTFGSNSVLVSPNRTEEIARSSRAVEAGSLYPLHITAKNKAGETTAMLGVGTRSGNLPALSNDANTDIPVAYIVDPENGEANVFQNCEDSDAEGFTLGVYTKLNAPVDLYVDNIDRSRFKMLLLEDRLTGKVQDLLQNPLYSFVNEPGYSGSRFYLRINHASPYSDHRGNINISVDSDKVGIQSQSPISRAMIFDMTGKLVVMQDGDSHTLTMNLPLNSSGEYIVKVQLADGTGTIKKLLKSF